MEKESNVKDKVELEDENENNEDVTVDEENNKDVSEESDKIYSKEEADKLLAEKDEEIQSLKDKLLRSHAEFDNYKKRNSKLQEQNKKLAIRNIAVDVIDINDNLLRASEAAKQIPSESSLEESHKNYVDGVLMISKSLEGVLNKYGIEEIVSLNESFDPNKHEAIEINMSDEVDIDTVTKVYQKGFEMEDFVIRSAKVCVTKPAPQNVESNSSDIADENNDVSQGADNEENK